VGSEKSPDGLKSPEKRKATYIGKEKEER